ncbi:MAG: S26 family signal peptidase, partial [Patescibacteria group bacterium]
TFRVDTKDNTLFVNGEPIKNGRNENYILDGQGRTMIGLYEKSFNGRMNGNVYFLFGENQASIDSSAFGPVSGADILGKVIKIIPAAN